LSLTWAASIRLAPASTPLAPQVKTGIARYLGFIGSYPVARDLFQLIADAYGEDDAYGPEDPDTLAVRANLAYWTKEAAG